MATNKPNHNPRADEHPERLIHLTDEELTAAETGLLRDHLATCLRCRQIRESVLSTRKRVLEMLDSKTSLHLEDPTPKDSARYANHIISRMPREHRALRAIQTISSAAALILLLLFIAEQVRSVQCISKLEKHLTTIEYTGSTQSFDLWTRYLAGANWHDLASRHGLDDVSLASLGPSRTTWLAQNREKLIKQIQGEIRNRRPTIPRTNTPTLNPTD